MEQLHISYQGLESSPALNDMITTRAQRLARLCERLNSLRVAVVTPGHRHRSGVQHRVRIELTIPGGDLVVDRDEPEDGDDVYVTVRRAFDSLRRRLCAVEERRRGKQYAHAGTGAVGRLARR
jgi:ribosomal subunit interface protein